MEGLRSGVDDVRPVRAVVDGKAGVQERRGGDDGPNSVRTRCGRVWHVWVRARSSFERPVLGGIEGKLLAKFCSDV